MTMLLNAQKSAVNSLLLLIFSPVLAYPSHVHIFCYQRLSKLQLDPPPPFTILRVFSLLVQHSLEPVVEVLILSSSAAFVGSIVLHYLDVSILCPELSIGDSGADCLPADECLLCFLSQYQGNSFCVGAVLFLMA